MKKKKSPKEIIERISEPHLETYLYKGKDKQAFKADKKRERYKVEPIPIEELPQDMKEDLEKGYAAIHTHPSSEPSPLFFGINDLKHFIENLKMKSFYASQRDEDSGEVKGYFVFRKTKRTDDCVGEKFKMMFGHYPKESKNLTGELAELAEVETRCLFEYYGVTDGKDPDLNQEGYYKVLKILSNKFGLKYRFIPAKGYKLSNEGIKFVPKEGGLEKTLNVLLMPSSIIFLILGLFFLSSNLTGYAVLGMAFRDVNLIGAALFVFGISLLYLSFRKSKLLRNKKC